MTFNEIIQTLGRRFKKSVYYYVDGEKIELDADDFDSATLKFNTSLIGTTMESLTLVLKTPIYGEIYLEVEAYLDDENTATKTYGPYYLKEDPTYDASAKTYSHTCYDAMLEAMVDYEAIDIEYPCFIQNFYDKLIDTLGFISDVNLINGNLSLESDIYTGINYTYRDVLEDIARANGVLLYADGNVIKENVLKNDTPAIINDDILKNANIEFGEHFGPINSIVLSRSADSDSIYLQDEESIEENGLHEFKISDNQLMNDNNRDEFLPGLLEKLDGIEYDIFDTELTGYGGFEPLQPIIFYTGDNSYKSYVFNNEIEFATGYKETIYTEIPDESVTNYSVSDTTDKRINEAYMLVNKQEQTIEGLLSEVYDEDGIVNKNYTQLLQSINDIIYSVQTSGGSNLIKNSVMFSYDNDGIPTEWEVGETGSLTIGSLVESLTYGGLSGHGFTLNGKTVSQKVTVSPDSYYSFATKIKKSLDGSCSVKIYNELDEYIIELNENETSTYKEYTLKAMKPSTNYFIVEFYASDDCNATFTDNVLTVGEYTSQWCQANGEIMNTQVNINTDGVLIKSSIYEGNYTIMSPLEFAGYANINGTVTKVFTLNNETTEVKKLSVDDGISMPPIKIVPITSGDRQGWAFVKTS